MKDVKSPVRDMYRGVLHAQSYQRQNHMKERENKSLPDAAITE
jgi:hypothetical protein